MRRREFITVVGGAAVSWPLAARAQLPDRMRRIGVLMGYAESDSEGQAFVVAFREGLQKLGWVENRNVRIDYRRATSDDSDSIERFAKELVALRPDLILSNNTPTTAAMLQQTRAIPIIFALVNDPIGGGFVASLARPGGNATGFMAFEGSMAGKWLELLKEIAPRVTRVAFLFNPATAPYAEYFLSPFKTAAASFAVEGIAAPVHDGSEVESVVAAHAREPNGGVIVMPSAFATIHRMEITSLVARYNFLPSIRSVSSLNSAAYYPTEMISSTIFGARLRTSIASSRAQSRASFPSRPPSSSSWSSTSKPRRRSVSTCLHFFDSAPTR
jgi:putative ABC transport system substrate-binding protein